MSEVFDEVYVLLVSAVFGDHEGCQCATCTLHWRMGKADQILDVLDLPHPADHWGLLDEFAKLRKLRKTVKDDNLLDRIVVTTGDIIAKAKAELAES